MEKSAIAMDSEPASPTISGSTVAEGGDHDVEAGVIDTRPCQFSLLQSIHTIILRHL